MKTAVTLVFVLGLCVAGCRSARRSGTGAGSGHHEVSTSPEAEEGSVLASPSRRASRYLVPVVRTIKLKIPEEPVSPGFYPQKDDVQQVIRFAVGLAEEGAYDDAAKVFLEGAKRFVSKDQLLEHDLVKAAIRCHWLAGNLKGVHEDFVLLDEFYGDDFYARFREEGDVRKIRQIVLNPGSSDSPSEQEKGR